MLFGIYGQKELLNFSAKYYDGNEDSLTNVSLHVQLCILTYCIKHQWLPTVLPLQPQQTASFIFWKSHAETKKYKLEKAVSC